MHHALSRFPATPPCDSARLRGAAAAACGELQHSCCTLLMLIHTCCLLSFLHTQHLWRPEKSGTQAAQSGRALPCTAHHLIAELSVCVLCLPWAMVYPGTT